MLNGYSVYYIHTMLYIILNIQVHAFKRVGGGEKGTPRGCFRRFALIGSIARAAAVYNNIIILYM